ncbi:DNA helicase PIF1, ATP-dependent [Tanacetum coccineum]
MTIDCFFSYASTIANRLYLSSTSSSLIINDEKIPVLRSLKIDDSGGLELTKEVLPGDNTLPKPGTLENLLMWARNHKYDSATFHCEVKIDKIRTKNGWNFPSCEGRNVRRATLPTRYKLELEISNDTAKAVIVMFDETTTGLLKCYASAMVASQAQDEDEHSGLPAALANIVGTIQTLELKSHTYYEHQNYESFTCWRIVADDAVEGVLTLAWLDELEYSDAEASFVADSQPKGDDVGCSFYTKKKRVGLEDSQQANKFQINSVEPHRHLQKAVHMQKKKEIVDTPDHPFPQTAPRTTGKKARKPAALSSAGTEVSYYSLGALFYQRRSCNATMWYEERNNKGNKTANPTFSLCCQEDKNELRNRLNAFGGNETGDSVDGIIVGSLIQMLDQNSSIAQAFRMSRDWCHSNTSVNVQLRMISERKYLRQYNASTIAEVAALIANDFGDGDPTRDIIVSTKDGRPKRISKLHPSYMALQYPLLFPYGEDGYHDKILYHRNIGVCKTNKDYVTMKEYYAYVIQHRQNQRTTLLRGGRLFQHYLVDAYTAIEEQRLSWTRNNQDTLRVDLYHNVCDAITRGDTNAAGLRKRIVLFHTFTRGPRYMMQNYQDAMALCRAYGNPNLFITFTSNPKWLEINEMLAHVPGQRAYDQPEMGTGFSFDIHYSYPSVMKLNFHLPNQQPVTLRDSECLPALLERKGNGLEPHKRQEETWEILSKDILHLKRKLFKYPELQLTAEQIQNYCLVEIQEVLNRNGRSLTEFQDLPRPNPKLLTNMDNRLIREALEFDMNKSRIEHQWHRENFFMQNYHFKAKIRAKDCPWITSLLLPTERTAHSRFVIPLELLENNTCGIKQNTHLAELMQEVELIIWDEAPITQKYAFEALDKTLRDILGYPTPTNRDKIFGGLTVLLGGDFRQILPAIPKGKRFDIMQACINHLELLKHCKVFTLIKSMRVNEYYANGKLDTRK